MGKNFGMKDIQPNLMSGQIWCFPIGGGGGGGPGLKNSEFLSMA